MKNVFDGLTHQYTGHGQGKNERVSIYVNRCFQNKNAKRKKE